MVDRPIIIIAECGINHNGDTDLAREMILTAKECGADIAKVQIYVPDRLMDQNRPNIKKHWKTIKAAELSFEDVRWLKAVCDAVDIEFLASVFHPDRVEWTERIGMERYKIASRSLYDKKLAKAIRATGKPVIRSWGYYKISLGPVPYVGPRRHELYCVSKYPTSLKELDMPQSFDQFFTGFSDHTASIMASVVAMARGARIIEKHFTMDKTMPGHDQAFSMDPSELKQLCDMRNNIEEIHESR